MEAIVQLISFAFYDGPKIPMNTRVETGLGQFAYLDQMGHFSPGHLGCLVDPVL